MQDRQKTKAQLIDELAALRARVADLEAARAAAPARANGSLNGDAQAQPYHRRAADRVEPLALPAHADILRTLHEQPQFFELMARGAALDALLHALARVVEAQIDGSLCAVLLLDADAIHLRHAAAPSLPSAYCHAIDGLAIGPHGASWGMAAYLGQVVISADIASDPLWEDQRAHALAHGLRACWAVPFYDSRARILGTIAVYQRTPARPAPIAQEQLTHAAALAALVVELQRNEAALRASELRHRGLTDALPLLLWIDSINGELVYTNERCVEFFGPTFNRYKMNGWAAAIHPDDRHNEQQRWRAALHSGRGYVIEYRLRRHDGVYRWHLVHIMPIAYEPGQGVYWVGTATDIDDQKRNQEALRESETLYAMASRATSDVIWDWNILTHAIHWNECAQSMFGYTADQVGNYPLWWDEHLHPDDRERASHSVQAVIESGEQFWSCEYRFRRADQSYADILDRGYVVRDADGTPLRMIGAMQDITERTRAADQIRQLNTGLEQRVAQRTAQLELANKELEAFSYSVSHDLSAPLRHIDGFARLLAQREAGRLDAASARYVQVISDAARKMRQLIDDLLAFSRMGRTEMQTLPVNLARIVAEIRHDLTLAAEQRVIHWQVGDLPIVSGDPAMVRLVLVNLLSNAVKYTARRAEAHISVRATPAANGELVITVADNGIGFDMHYAQTLFGVFQRLHSDAEFEGSGIGLATVQRIVHRHGGRVWAESVPDQGAAFHVSLQRYQRDTPGA